MMDREKRSRRPSYITLEGYRWSRGLTMLTILYTKRRVLAD
nr:MAG TPA: hypothetical protein [Caudoviricetes sp.]